MPRFTYKPTIHCLLVSVTHAVCVSATATATSYPNSYSIITKKTCSIHFPYTFVPVLLGVDYYALMHAVTPSTHEPRQSITPPHRRQCLPQTQARGASRLSSAVCQRHSPTPPSVFAADPGPRRLPPLLRRLPAALPHTAVSVCRRPRPAAPPASPPLSPNGTGSSRRAPQASAPGPPSASPCVDGCS